MSFLFKSFVLFASFFLTFAATASAQDLSANGAEIEEGKYTILNHKWGEPDAYQNIWSWRVGESWGWGSYINKTGNFATNSPLAYLGWRWSEPEADSQLPVIIWNNDPVTTNANWKITGNGNRILNVGYNMWFHDQFQQINGLDWQDSPQARISIWLHVEGNRNPAGTLRDTVWIAGKQWQLYRHQASNDNDWDAFTFRPINGSVNRTELQLSDFINHVVYDKGWMTNDRILSGVEFGCEVARASETVFEVADFYIDVNSAPAPRDTMYVNGRHLYSATGEKIILRGVNCGFGYTLPKRDSWPRYAEEIAKTNANCVRIVWDVQSYLTTEALEEAITLCIENKMIPMVELHGATGLGPDELERMVDYWVRPDIVDLVNRHQKWLMLNVANEALQHISNQTFSDEYNEAIDRIRGAGIKVPIVIDASNFGTNYPQVFQTWKGLRNRDPEQNLMFSLHTYWQGGDQQLRDIYEDIINGVKADNIPLLFGEGPQLALFSNCAQRSPYRYGLRRMQEEELGWLVWSWGTFPNGDCKPEGGGVSSFDITTDGFYGNWNDLNNDGNKYNDYAFDLIVADPNSLQKTSVRPEGLR